MAPRDFISDLPVELSHRILETFSYMEMLPALGCCRRWRQIAIDCPTYSSHIGTSWPTEGQAHTLELRIQRGRRCPLTLFLALLTPSNVIPASILPTVALRFDCIVWLKLYIHISYSIPLFEIIVTPASQLVGIILRIEVDYCDEPLPVLPHNLFQGHAPQLIMAWFENLLLPSPPPPVLRSVLLAGYGYQQAPHLTPEVPNMWSSFPGMRALVISGNAVLGRDTLAAWTGKSLHRLLLHTYEASLEQSFRVEKDHLAGVPHIQTLCVTPWLVETLASHIDGAIQLALRYISAASEPIHVYFGDCCWQRSRCFASKFTDIESATTSPVNLLFQSIAAERMVSVTFPDAVWEYVARDCFPLVSALELRIVFNLDGGVKLGDLSILGRIACPALRCLIFRCDEGNYFVTPSQVSCFIASSLIGARLPLQLLLEGVTLVPDDGEPIASRYELFHVHWSTKDHWDYPFFDVYDPDIHLTTRARDRYL